MNSSLMMMKHVKSYFQIPVLRSMLAIACIIFWGNVGAQGIEYEIAAGPQTTKALIKDYDVGIVGNDSPKNNRLLYGYVFNLTIRTKLARFQPGLRIKNDLSRYNVYLPVFWPSDYMAKDQSRWDHIYKSHRLGLGANLRMNLGNIFIQPGFAYLFEFSEKTIHEFYYGSTGDVGEAPGVDYSSGSGAAGDLEFGIKLGKAGHKKFGLTAGIQYLFSEQSYTDEVFLQHWIVQPINFYLLFSYRFESTEKG